MEIVQDIKDIESRLETAGPHELAEMKLKLSSIYSRMSEMLMEIFRQKPGLWNKIREGVKSDTAAERSWEATNLGLREMELKQWLKVIEKMISSINTMLRIYEGEAHNQM